jgi:acetyltransferase-like isoleucine patch superfamily enzyme
MSWLGEVRRRRSLLTANLLNRAWQRIQQAGVVTAASQAGQRFAAFGPRSMLAFPAGSVYGERWICIGDETMIADHVTICAGMAPGHDLGPDPVLRIGDRCVIGRGSHIVAHHSIDIGSDVFTGPYVYVTDQNHQYEDPDVPIGRQWPVNSAVSIGAGCWLGTGTVILPGSRLGRNVVVAAGSVVRGEVPDHCVVAGVPAKVVRSYVPGDGWSRPAARAAAGAAAIPVDLERG